jgi:hypothetical protein
MSALFVTIDVWEGPRNRQWLHHLICRCGSVLASAGGRTWTTEVGPGEPEPVPATPAAVGIGERIRLWLRRLVA